MGQLNVNDLKGGFKVEVDGQPYTVVSCQLVKPGKGQAFTRVKLKHLITGRVIERTFKSGEKVDEADVQEAQMRMLYRDGENIVFMDDKSFEQISIPVGGMGDVVKWLKEDLVYDVVIYRGTPVSVEPPTFMDLKVVETEPGVKGDTASGRVLKPARTETGAEVKIPLFIDRGEIVRFDTRTGEYVSRVSKE
jgi:elongation factor P